MLRSLHSLGALRWLKRRVEWLLAAPCTAAMVIATIRFRLRSESRFPACVFVSSVRHPPTAHAHKQHISLSGQSVDVRTPLVNKGGGAEAGREGLTRDWPPRTDHHIQLTMQRHTHHMRNSDEHKPRTLFHACRHLRKTSYSLRRKKTPREISNRLPTSRVFCNHFAFCFCASNCYQKMQLVYRQHYMK